MSRPSMWIMKITPDTTWDSETIFENLFLGDGSKNVIGWSGSKKEGNNFEIFMGHWESMKVGDVVVVMKGLKHSLGAVMITSDPYEEEEGDPHSDWFKYRRGAKLIKHFDPPMEHKVKTNRNRIIRRGKNAEKIMDEVWTEIEKDYKSVTKEVAYEEEVKRMDPYKDLLERFHQIILTGPPGTGKTYRAKRIAAYLLGIKEEVVVDNEEKCEKELRACHFSSNKEHNEGAWDLVQFHPSYNYEDFVRGIQVTTTEESQIQYETVDRIFGRLARVAKENKGKNYVLIIDEINRANLAAVLGELIYGLEYRDSPITTPYEVEGENDKGIVIPENLFIIGTMNTADRSIGHIDYAIRRRFLFLPVGVEKEAVEEYYEKKIQLEENDNQEIKILKDKAKKLYRAVSKLFKDEEGYLSPDFFCDDVQIGHTYFFAEDEEELSDKFIYQVYPLLREYYKDGILIPKDLQKQNGIEIKIEDKLKISISKTIPLEEIEKELKDYFQGNSKGQEGDIT